MPKPTKMVKALTAAPSPIKGKIVGASMDTCNIKAGNAKGQISDKTMGVAINSIMARTNRVLNIKLII